MPECHVHDVREVHSSKTRKRENAKRENDFRVFNFTLKFQKREFKIQKKFTSWSKVK